MSKIISAIIAGVLLAGGAFYAGMKYGAGKNPASTSPSFSQADQGGQGQFNQLGGVGATGVRGGRGTRGGFIVGEIIAKDETSITVNIRDPRLPEGTGGSKIVFITPKTPVTKSVSGALKDLNVGEQVTIMSTPNPDGSVTAESVQIRQTLREGQ